MLQLTNETTRLINGKATPVRAYKNTITGTEVSIYLLHTDKQGNKWWTFEDLFQLPMIRQMAAKKVLDLYGNGLALDDVKGISAQIKALAKGGEPDKYERIYAKCLEMDNLAETMADPVKQCMGLCTVYLLLNDEVPDVWTNPVSSQKMGILALDTSLQSFFLNWWTGIMRQSGAALKGLSQIALNLAER